jgi:hypothetical protein
MWHTLTWRAFVAVLFGMTACRAEPFKNLDFELAQTNNVVPFPEFAFPNGQGLLSDLLPGWSLSIGGTESSAFFLNGLALDGGGASILSREALGYYQSSLPELGSTLFPWGIEGKYGFADSIGAQSPMILSQTGDVPANARFIVLEGDRSPGVEFQLYANGKLIENGDISVYAGRPVQLEIGMRRTPGPSGNTASINRILFGAGPLLNLSAGTDGLLLIWSSVPTNFVLQASESLSESSIWKDLKADNDFQAPNLGTTRYLRVSRVGPARFFRLIERPRTTEVHPTAQESNYERKDG